MGTKRSFIMILTAVLAMAAMSPAAWAARPLKGCSLNGTWSGWADSSTSPSMMWLALQTTDSNDNTKGELLMNWVGVSSDLLTVGGTYAATHLTPGHGVWQQTASNNYNYTWYAYGIDANGIPLYSVTVAGTVTFATTTTDCDTAGISYSYGVFSGIVTPQEMSANPQNAVYGTSGQAGETKVPLVTVTQ